MLYLMIVIAMVLLSLGGGLRFGHAIATTCARRPFPAGVVIVAAACAWLGAAFVARTVADGDAPGWALAEWFGHRGKWYTFVCGMLFMLGVATRTPALPRRQRLSLVVLVLLVVWLLVWRTMPSFVWLPRASERDDRGHLRQSVETTCGPIALGNLLEQAFGRHAPTERELARLSGTTDEGTPMTGLMRAGRHLGLKVAECRVLSEEELRAYGVPAIVQISTIPEVRHATLLLGFTDGHVRFIDPSYGFLEITEKRFRDIWYGKSLVFTEPGKE